MTTDLGNDQDPTPLPVLLNLCALGLVLTVIPLVVLQIPDAVAWVVPPRVAAAGPGAVASLLRASGLALPAMAVAGSLAALMVRWPRGPRWPPRPGTGRWWRRRSPAP